MAASGGEGERSGLGKFVKSQTKYGTTTKSTHTNDTFYKYHVSKGETIQGIALKHGVTMEQIKRANNIWTNDSLFLREYLLIPIESDPRSNSHQTSLPNGNIPQASTSATKSIVPQDTDMEIITRQELHNASKITRSKSLRSPSPEAMPGGNNQKHSPATSVGEAPTTAKDNFKDFLNRMDSNLEQIKSKAKQLDKTSQFPEDLHNPLNLLPKKTSIYGKRSSYRRSIDIDSFDLAAEPELSFRSSNTSHVPKSSTEKLENKANDKFHL